MSENIEEGLIEEQPIPVDIEGTKLILSQMENCICKIVKDNGHKGTGFFCLIPFPDNNNLLKVLITNNHILNENDIQNYKMIKFIMYNKERKIEEEKKIRIDESRKKFTIKNEEEGIDLTIIEIRQYKDEINDFLRVDDNILELDCKRKSIYILHYPKDKRLVSYGLLNDIYEGKKINHYCNTEYGSSGSPILSLNNFKVIGVHYGGSQIINAKFNFGTFIKYAINDFNNKYKNEIIKYENNKLEITNEFEDISEKSTKYDTQIINNDKNYELDSFHNIKNENENQILNINLKQKKTDIPIELNNVKNRFLPLPESVAQGLENEAKITDFQILIEIGSGSLGKVYRVTHKVTKAEYAIKAIDKRDKTNQEIKPYFRREIEIMYKIHHPNVIKLYGHFEDNNYCYFIMEYSSKGNVYNLLSADKKKSLSTKVYVSLIIDVISAVYFLHNMKPPIIHRDIKPENILLSDGLIAKLSDFIWSNYIQVDEKRTTVCGTPIYLAPEILKEKGHDEAVDIWCIGVLLFELITGNVPFQGNDIDTLKDNILNLKITWPRDINKDAKDLIKQILKLEPKERLPLEEMLKHPFITQYFPDAIKRLIKPEVGAKYKPFIISKDDPKVWQLEKI